MSIKPNMHTPESLRVYADGMSRSQPDKAKIGELLTPGTVVEIGCGNGTVLDIARNTKGITKVVGIDQNPHLLRMARANLAGSSIQLIRIQLLPDVDRLESQYDRLVDIVGFAPDNIIFSSTLHEIASESPDPRTSVFPELHIRAASKWLGPEGILVIRDGIKPGSALTLLKFKNPKVQDLFFKFADEFSYPFEFQLNDQPDQVLIRRDHLYEFLTKYIYETNWDIEVQELFGWANDQDIKYMVPRYMGMETWSTYLLPYFSRK